MPKHYRKSPIANASCTFSFDLASTSDITVPGLVYAVLRNNYPVRQGSASPQRSTSDKTATRPMAVVGIAQFGSENGSDLVQVGPGMLRVVRSSPYDGWKYFWSRIEEALGAYRSIVSPNEIEGLSLAYNNKLDLPRSVRNIEEFLDFYPYLGSRLPQEVGPFSLAVEVSENENDVLRFLLQPLTASTPDVTSLMLAVDYLTTEKQPISWDSVKQWMETAHTRVSEVFEGCLKDAARALFESE
jgi:uncharacterized protein (TIGR04255 family)